MTYKCNTCNKQYSSYQSLWIHNKKFHITEKHGNITETPEIITEKLSINKLQCKYCTKLFKHPQNRYEHEKKVCCKKQTKSEIQELKEEINLLKNTINKSKNKIINNNNGIIQNNKIIINNFNEDKIDYISENFMNKLFKNLMFEDEYNIPIPRLIENIKFNSNHKENNNIKITNKRSDVGYKYDNNKWLTVDKDQLLNELFKIGVDVFMKFYQDKHKDQTDDMKECYDEFIQTCKYDLKDEIKNKIEKLAYIYTKNIELDS
jgi:hypothetical protein